MNIPKGEKCCGKTFDGWRSHPCRNKASVEREGRYYCKIHDPMRVAEREEIRKQKMEAEYENRRWMMVISHPKYQIMKKALELICEDYAEQITAREMKTQYLAQAKEILSKKEG